MGHETLIKHYCLHLVIVLTVCSAYNNGAGVNDLTIQSNSNRSGQPTYSTDHNVTRNNSDTSSRAKFLRPFTVINFANTMCTVGNVMGVCVTSTECSSTYGGSRIGTCAAGFGTCCYKAIKCGESSSMNVTYIQNPDYPGTTSGTAICEQKIEQRDNVCNLRLDFVEFDLTDPFKSNGDAKNGHCLNDKMTVTTTGISFNQFEYLCGKMPPIWHFYIDVRDALSPTTFTFDLRNDDTKARKWNIKVTQVCCDIKIPQGCGQYFTGTSGDPFYSFNFGNNDMYLQGMNYGICFRQEKGYCTHTYIDNGPSWVACNTNSGGDQLAFPNGYTTNMDQKDCNSIGDLIIAAAAGNTNPWPSPMTTNNFSPTIIYFWTDQNNNQRYLEINAALPQPAPPGFCFSWQANKC